MTSNSRDQASQADLQAGQHTRWELSPLQPPPCLWAVKEESQFAWSDDSWDPMTTEFVAVFSTRKLAEAGISSKRIPTGERRRPGSRVAYDIHDVPLITAESNWMEINAVHVVFVTHYQGLAHYDDDEGRVHVTYRTDQTGFPLKAFTDRAGAEEMLAELNRTHREETPRGGEYHGGPDYRRAPLAYCCPHRLASIFNSTAELTSLDDKEFEEAADAIGRKYLSSLYGQFYWTSERQQAANKRISDFNSRRNKRDSIRRDNYQPTLDDLIGDLPSNQTDNARAFEFDDLVAEAMSHPQQREGWLRFSDAERSNPDAVFEQLKMDSQETAEEAALFDEKARQVWRIMDRVVLFKIVTMTIDDALVMED